MRRRRLHSALLAALFAALLAFGCAAGQHATPVLPPIVVVTYARLMRMTDSRRIDTLLLRSALRSGERPLRGAAALAIGQVGGREMLGDLRALLTDADTAVAANAAFSLGLLHDSVGIQPLASALHAAPSVAVEAAWALGQIGARDPIVSALAAGASGPLAGALLIAAGKLRPVPGDAIAPYLRHPDAEVRWRAAYAFARPAAPGAAARLLPLAGDPSAEVRAQVARALTRRLAGDTSRADALAVLRTLVADRDAHVRINAVRSLASFGGDVRAAVLAVLRDRDANVRIAAAQSLGDVLDSTLAPWTAAWNADTGFTFRRSVLIAARRAAVALPAMDSAGSSSWLRSQDWRLRAAVAEAGGGGVAGLSRWVLPLTRDADGRVRAAAIDALAPFADSTQHPEIRVRLLDALADADFYARASAIGALGRRPSAAELPRVLDSYRLAWADSTNDARLAAVRYMAAAWRRDSAAFPEALRRQVAGLDPPHEALVAAEAKNVSILAAWRAAELPLAPLSWYEQRLRTWVLPALGGRQTRARITTERGVVVLELFASDAPLTVDNFATLAAAHFYDGARFHRVVPNFVAQDGDPRGDGNGGPPYTIRDELNRHRYDRGAVGMALSGPDTGGSQYFLTLSPQPHLDGAYTVFGRVIAGFDVLDRLVQGDRILTIRVQ